MRRISERMARLTGSPRESFGVMEVGVRDTGEEIEVWKLEVGGGAFGSLERYYVNNPLF